MAVLRAAGVEARWDVPHNPIATGRNRPDRALADGARSAPSDRQFAEAV
jgi:hypothetical protein